jgi:hypothetical protein
MRTAEDGQRTMERVLSEGRAAASNSRVSLRSTREGCCRTGDAGTSGAHCSATLRSRRRRHTCGWTKCRVDLISKSEMIPIVQARLHFDRE